MHGLIVSYYLKFVKGPVIAIDAPELGLSTALGLEVTSEIALVLIASTALAARMVTDATNSDTNHFGDLEQIIFWYD